MPTFHFFTNSASLQQTPEQKYGPVLNQVATQYRVTSLFSASSAPKAYAVCSGKIFAQKVGGRINLVLRPTEQPIGLAAPVKYYIYKGLSLASLVDGNNDQLIADRSKSDLTKTIHESQERRNAAFDELMKKTPGTTTIPPSINAVGLHLTAAAPSPNTLLDTAFIDDVFMRLDDDEFPSVDGGASLGDFNPAAFGFEVVLDGLGEGPTLQTLRNTATIIPANATTTGPVGRFRDDDLRERILQYIDPCAFYAVFFFGGVEVKRNTSDEKFTTIQKDSLYNDVLTKFKTFDTVYLDLRNEHNHSLNYYRNYNSASEVWAQFQIRYDGVEAAPLKDYHSHGWPIYIIPTSVFTNTAANTPSTLTLNLPRGDNLSPMLLLVQGYFYNGFRRMDQVPDRSETLRVDIQSDSFTVPITFSIPKLANNKTVPGLIEARYLKRIGSTTTPADPAPRVLPAEHFVDNFFELTALLSDTGPNIPLNTDDVARWHLTGSTAVVGEGTVDQPARVVNIGIGEDESKIYFFACASNAEMVTGSSKSKPPLAVLGDAHLLTLDFSQSEITDSNNVKHPVLNIEGLPPAIGNTEDTLSDLNVDAQSMFALVIHRDELPSLLSAVNALEPGFDKRLALRNETNFVDPSGNAVTGTQYDLFVVGYQLGASVAVRSIDTTIKLLHLPWTPGQLSSEAATATFDVLNPVDANRKRFARSKIAKGIIAFLRLTPRLPKSDESPSNLICATRGTEHGVNVLGKKRTEGDNRNEDPNNTVTINRVWYYVELQEPFTLLGPETPRPVRCWIAADLLYIVAPFDRFITDLIEITDAIDEAQTPEPLIERITRIRMRTKEAGIISVMFDALIADPSSLGPPAVVRLHDNDNYFSGQMLTLDNISQIGTRIGLFEDYMGVAIGKGQVVDLHHLFIGMDAVNHPNPNAEINPGLLSPLLSALPNQSVGSNIDATTWAGDIGAIPADFMIIPEDATLPGADWRYHLRWHEDNPSATPDQAAVAFMEHYWETRAKNEDLLPDVYCHLLRERLIAQVVSNPSANRNLAALLYHYNRELQSEGDGHALKIFAKRLGLKPDIPLPYTSYPTISDQIAHSIFLFAKLWYYHTFQFLDISLFLDEVEQLSENLARQFLSWLQNQRHR